LDLLEALDSGQPLEISFYFEGRPINGGKIEKIIAITRKTRIILSAGRKPASRIPRSNPGLIVTESSH
jgi:hypothetical protein